MVCFSEARRNQHNTLDILLLRYRFTSSCLKHAYHKPRVACPSAAFLSNPLKLLHAKSVGMQSSYRMYGGEFSASSRLRQIGLSAAQPERTSSAPIALLCNADHPLYLLAFNVAGDPLPWADGGEGCPNDTLQSQNCTTTADCHLQSDAGHTAKSSRED